MKYDTIHGYPTAFAVGYSITCRHFQVWRQHLANFRRGAGCPALRDAFKKYGEEAFEFQILFFCFDEDRFHYEIAAIAKYNTQVPNGYNIAKGGQGGGAFAGKTHTPETIAKIQPKLQVYRNDPEWIRKSSERSKTAMASPEVRKKLTRRSLKKLLKKDELGEEYAIIHLKYAIKFVIQ